MLGPLSLLSLLSLLGPGCWVLIRIQGRHAAHGVVVSHLLSMQEAMGSIPNVSTTALSARRARFTQHWLLFKAQILLCALYIGNRYME